MKELQKIIIIVFAVMIVNSIWSQSKSMIFSCEIDEDIFCGSQLEIYSDSTFSLSQGCEHNQSIQIGKMQYLSRDTFYLKTCEINFDCIFDSIVYISEEINKYVDTIDVFYFDKFGEYTFSKDNRLANMSIANIWIDSLTMKPYMIPRNEDCKNFNRSFSYFEKHNKSYTSNHPFYYVNSTYIVNPNVRLGFLFVDYYEWTGERKILEIPSNTKRIHIYYALPKDVITMLQIYQVKLDHKKNVIFYTCGNKVFCIE